MSEMSPGGNEKSPFCRNESIQPRINADGHSAAEPQPNRARSRTKLQSRTRTSTSTRRRTLAYRNAFANVSAAMLLSAHGSDWAIGQRTSAPTARRVRPDLIARKPFEDTRRRLARTEPLDHKG